MAVANTFWHSAIRQAWAATTVFDRRKGLISLAIGILVLVLQDKFGIRGFKMTLWCVAAILLSYLIVGFIEFAAHLYLQGNLIYANVKSELESKDKRLAEIAAERPHFEASEVVRVFFNGDLERPAWLKIFVFIRLRNLGIDSAVERWQVHFEGQGINFTRNEAGLSPSQDDDGIAPHQGGNLLHDKTIIKNRGIHGGWLLCHDVKDQLGGLTTGQESRVIVTVSFRDTEGNCYTLPEFRP
jgi:hypothetical protein